MLSDSTAVTNSMHIVRLIGTRKATGVRVLMRALIPDARESLSVLKPIDKANLPKEVIRQIVSEVNSGSLKPGDKLPSERELGGLFNVGRSSIREGLKVLEAVGIVRRTTEGTILCRPGEMEDPSIWLGGICTDIHEVFETRKLMEIELAGLAAKRATPENVERICATIVKRYDEKGVRASDLAFHRAIVEAAGNKVFSQVYNLVAGLLFERMIIIRSWRPLWTGYSSRGLFANTQKS